MNDCFAFVFFFSVFFSLFVMIVSENSTVIPGDRVGVVGESELRIGPGIMQSSAESLSATQGGTLCYKPKHSYWWVSSPNVRRYVPALEDLVVGIVSLATQDYYYVDIGAAHNAVLPAVDGFEGATQRNRPRLVAGTLVYARVTRAARDLDPQIECMSIRKHADGFGELAGGTIVRVPLGFARSLLDPNCAVLLCLGELIPYEVAVGMNGRVWVKAGTAAETIVCANAIENSAKLESVNEVKAMCEELVRRTKRVGVKGN